MKTARIVCGLVALGWALASWPALAQRVQFPTPATTDGTSASGVVQPSTSSPYPGPATAAPSGTVSSPPSATFSSPGATLGSPTTPTPTYTPSPSTYTPAPSGTPSGVVQPPPANWDPYATPGAGTSPLLQQDPYLTTVAPPMTMATMQKFLQHVDLDYHWFAGHNGAVHHNQLGINDVALSATFAIPIFHNTQTPLLITPAFAVHCWEGPVSIPPTPADLPPQTYDALLDAAWNPQITPWFGGELDFSVGVYSDFKHVKDDVVLPKGKGLVVLTFSPSMKIKAGVWYLNRNRVKILPAGGICWTPNADIYFDILFPNPKVGKRLTTWGNTEWWLYASGEYGGGRWGITRNSGLVPPVPTDGAHTTFDYNDIRIALGLEFNTIKQFHGMFEVGGAFSREVVYQSGTPPPFYPNNTVYIRSGLAY